MATSNFKVKNGVEVTEVLYVSGSCSLRNVGILGPVDPDVSGITVHGDISASGTIFVAGSAIGGSSSSSLASGAGGSLNELQYNNSGILDGAAGLIYQESDGYLGLGISNAQERLTVAGNISGAGSINIGSVIVAGHVDGRNIAEDAASVVAASGTWDSVYSTFKANSAEYESTFATLKPNSGGWTDTESTVRTNSGTWTAGASLAFKTIALSGNRPSAAIGADIVADSTTDTLTLCAGPNIVLVSPLSGSNTDVITISGAPNTGDANVNTTVNVSSGSWDSTNTTVKGSSGSWDSTNTTVRGSSGSWDSTNSTLNANSARYDRTALSLETNVVPNSARYGRTALSLETNVVASTANWNSTYNQVQDSTTDLNVDSGTLVVDKSANRVGIGTTAPNKLLTVVGDVSATGDIYASSLIADGETLYFRNANGIVDRDSGPKISTTQGGSVVIQASTTSGSAGTVVVITSAGTVASVTSGEETRVEIGGYPSSFTTSLSTLATVFASGGNSKDWNSTYNVVKATSATWTDNIADIAEIAALSATWTTAYTRSNGVVTIHSDVSDAGSGAIITGDERDKFTRAWTNVSSNSSQWAEVKADIAEVAGVSATWTTAYTRSNGVVTIHSDVSDAGSGQIITADERDKFTRAWTNVSSNSSQWAEVKADIAEVAAVSANWTTGYDNSLLSRADLAGVASVSANWTTAYGYKQFKTVTLSANRAAAAIGADVVADSATDTITLCAGPNIVLISDPTNDVITISGSAGGGGGGGGSGDENVNTAVRGSSGSWDSTNTTLVANSSQWAEVKADIAEVAAVSANWTTAYTRSNGVVTIHSDVSDAGSGEIITAVERDKFTRAWTNVSGNSASYSSSFNSSALAAASARWNTNATTEVAAASARWNRTALSVETNVVPSTGSWNSSNTTVNTNSADWSYVAANSAGGIAPGRLSVDEEAIYTTVSTDARYFDVIALLHFEDANAATSTSDDSFGRRAVSFAGTAQISTAQKKFGTASLLLDGNSDYISLANASDLDFGTSPFTMECWFYYNAATAPEYATIFDRGDGSGGGTSPYWLAIKDDSGTYRLVGTADAAGGGANGLFENYAAATISDNTWYHIAFVRDGNNFYTYLNGTTVWALTGSSASAMADNNEPIYIGARGQSGTGAYWGGHIDEFRLTVGTCRYAGGITFTPSTDGLPGETRFNQTVITGVSASTGMTSFQLEDDDGTEVAVSEAKEVKFIGSGITTNWTDVSTGSDGDPYDLTFTVDAAQTGITSLLATDIKIGEDDQTKIDFETANEIHLYTNNSNNVTIKSDGKVGIGTTVPAKELTVAGAISAQGTVTVGNYTLPIADGSNTYVLTTNGSGTVAWTAQTDTNTTYTAGDGLTLNSADFDIDAAQTTITSVLAADLKIGEDDETKIDFETADEIHFYAANVEQVYLGDNIFGPQSDSDVDLGSTGVRWKDAYVDSITVTGEVDGASLDISGNADIDGTLEADVITVSGTALSEYIADTAGAMVTGNTETGIAVTYQDGDNTIDFAIAAAQTTITSVLAADLKFGEDDQTKIDFETADEIHFYAANVHQVKLIDNAFTPVADSDVDLGTSSLYWKDAYIDTITTTGDVTVGGSISVTEAAIANGDYILFLDGGSTGAAKKEAFADVATLLAGDGITATNSVLSNDVIGKQSLWIPAAAMYPTATNGCAALASLDSGGNTGPDLYTMNFDGAAVENAQFSIAMPSFWNESTVTFQVYWTSETTDTDGVVWGLAGVALADSGSLNTAFGSAALVTDANIGTAKDIHVTAESGNVTVAGSPAAGEITYFNLSRVVVNSGDTAAEDAKLIGIKIFYTVDDVHEA